tara:strand:+ start:1089 stop:1748 length:660 start_codon:yes stop_codon:yes gene_type:complete
MKAFTFLGLDKESQYKISRGLNFSDTIKTPKGLYKYVCTHFGLESLKEAGRGRKLQRERELYLMLSFELFKIPSKKKSQYFEMLGNILGRDRTTVHYQYENHYLGEYYKQGADTITMNGQRYMWHFYTILNEFKTEDYTDTIKELLIRKRDEGENSKISMELLYNRKAILNFIAMGYDYRDVNESFFGYTKTHAFKNAIKDYRPGLGRLIDYHVERMNK